VSTIVLLTEDNTTGEAIRILAQKVLKSRKPPEVLRRHIKRGRIFKKPEKLAALIKSISRGKKAKFIVCVDSECTPPQTTERNLDRCKKYLKQNRLVVNFVVVVHTLEAWLAADEEAIRAVLKPKGSITIPTNLESECHPEEILKEIFQKNDKEFDKSWHDLEIAKKANPAKIAQRCQSLRKFQEVLLRLIL
jgi:hypothetical protein